MCEEINEASEENVVEVLKAFDMMNIIKFTNAYQLLTPSEKQRFSQKLKADIYTSDEEVLNRVAELLKGDELRIMNVSYNADGSVDAIDVKINKAQFNASGVDFIIISYVGNKLYDVCIIPHTGILSDGSEIKLSDLGLKLADVKCESGENTKIKIMIWDCVSCPMPLLKASEQAL